MAVRFNHIRAPTARDMKAMMTLRIAFAPTGAIYESRDDAPHCLRANGARYESRDDAPHCLRANGARYESQGQARSASPLVTDNKIWSSAESA